MRTTVVVGNPKPNSRTLDAARRVATVLSGSDDVAEIDLATLGHGLLQWDDDGVSRALDLTAASHLVIFASPTYKGSYTGLLKLFLDQVVPDGLRGVLAVPVMLGAGPNHAMAPDLLLRPVLTELGSTTAFPGLHLSDKTYATDGRIEDYGTLWAPTVTSMTLAARTGR
nr:NAD(P)H-dependent oxidoreductase [Rhodococcus sp. (in: high G+C Gram-positive bacteria)]